MAMAVARHQQGESSGSSFNIRQHQQHLDDGKYVRYTTEQVREVYSECPKPTSLRRQHLTRECPILSYIDPKQIKAWFQNRREKQREESVRLQSVNRKLTAMNKLLMEENDRLQQQVSQLVTENGDCYIMTRVDCALQLVVDHTLIGVAKHWI